MQESNIAFLVLSCDKYSDLWEPYAQLFNKYWEDCPYDKYFATNQIPFDKYGFKSILMGEDKAWSMGLIYTLNNLKNRYDYVLLTLEDLFIIKNIDTDFVEQCIDEFINLEGNYLRLYTKIKPNKQTNKYFGEINKNIPYRHSCINSVWKIDFLLQILVPEENAWEFEKSGERRTAFIDKFYCATKNCFILSNTVIKGKWLNREYRKIKKILPDLKINRSFLSKQEERKLYREKYFLELLLRYIPAKFQTRVINYIRHSR
jgi:hypothetical protein